jgi:hypothetical protein
VAGTITLTSGELDITDSVDLQGPGAGIVTVNGKNASRVFVLVSANATISGLTITGGSASQGGGIYNASGLQLLRDSDSQPLHAVGELDLFQRRRRHLQ